MDKLDKNVQEKINHWLEGNYDEETKAELQKMLDDGKTDELTDAFYKDLEFGTGGLRGIMGIGTNRVNKYTLGMATQGLSNYLKEVYSDEQIKVVIAHDNRNNAERFASIVADVFSANGIHVYFFESLRPTPELSYAIRELGCHSGVMLTASHNPKEYSGYKAYWSDGCQVIKPHDLNIIAEVDKIESVDQVNFNRDESLVEEIGPEMDQKYIDRVASESIYPEVIKSQKDLNIVFSPIHGTAVDIVPRALKEVGFTNVNLVEEQCTVDGNFPTVVYPNPEEKEALTMALNKAKETNADLVMATDPDGDRVGIAIKNPDGEFELLNGNQTGVLLFNYVLSAWESKGLFRGNEYIVKTIVTTYLIDEIAKSKGVTCYNTLTGFKYIGALMTELEGEEKFIAGGEESYGYLVGDHVRDKDAVVACTMIAEMTAYYKEQGQSLYEALIDVYAAHGLYKEELISIKKAGKKGAEEIQKIMDGLRHQAPESFAGQKVVTVKDYMHLTETDVETGRVNSIDFPASNVLQFITEGGYIISARPSGTEPKIKFYISVNGKLTDKSQYSEKAGELDEVIEQIKSELDF
ncbi:phospho-sugar mutase [Rhodohalobacter sp.]|uniref:phospho-sugar mutase n=1 Tax=Rhodohalobacter sp. TaxID=1974210 RepID=UPI002ACEA04C|nr:phospho-sugar mutase [Rhodohalobacter sp.]MDZ7756859.1 phospho-sugar mutase [Rhodohalobacter sp.]